MSYPGAGGGSTSSGSGGSRTTGSFADYNQEFMSGWQGAFYSMMEEQVRRAAQYMGVAESMFVSQLNRKWDQIVNTINSSYKGAFSSTHQFPGDPYSDFNPLGGVQTGDPAPPLQWLRDAGAKIAVAALGLPLQATQFLSAGAKSISDWGKTEDALGGGPGGGGSFDPTKQLDRLELTERAQSLWRGLLLDEHKAPEQIADAYIAAIKANPMQRLDFDTFVLGKVRSTGRYKSLYKGKPEALSEREFIEPYMNTAMAVLRPRNVGPTAAAGAMFGASPEAFRKRVKRSTEYRSSSPFINRLESVLTNASKVLQG